MSLLFAVCGPSGVGKTTLCHRLLKETPGIVSSVSYTTRQARPGEEDGKAYHFVSEAQFLTMVENGDFAEHAYVHGNRYGTAREVIERAWRQGNDLLFDIDFQGVQQLKDSYPDELVGVLLLPPGMEELERRLRARNTDDEHVIQRRLHAAREEMKQFQLFDFMVVNDELERAYHRLSCVYEACHWTRPRQTSHLERLLSR